MKIKKHVGLALAAALVMSAAAPVAATAAEAPITLTQEDINYFRDAADRFGVAPDVQDTLLAKVQAGIPLDSSTGVAATSVWKGEVDGYERTIETFPDGSVIGTDIEIPVEHPEGVAARGVSGCTYGSSAGVSYGQDCWVYTSSLTMGASFYASYSRWRGGTEVANWHSPSINIVGGSLIKRSWSKSSGGSTSYIQLSWNSQTGGVVTINSWLRFNVSASSVSQTRGGTW